MFAVAQPEMDDTVETTRELVRTVTEADAVLVAFPELKGGEGTELIKGAERAQRCIDTGTPLPTRIAIIPVPNRIYSALVASLVDRPPDDLIIENLAHLLALARRSPEECEALLNAPQGRA